MKINSSYREQREAGNIGPRNKPSSIAEKFWGTSRGTFPGRTASGAQSPIGFGLDRHGKKQATRSDYFKRSAIFAIGGSGAMREDFRNSFGILSKRQKSSLGWGSRITNLAVRGFAIGGMGLTMAEGGNMMDYTADYVLPGVGLMKGLRVGNELGAGITGGKWGHRNAAAAIGKTTLRGGLALGGAAVGLAAGVLIGSGIKDIGNSGGVIASALEDFSSAEYAEPFKVTEGTLSHRQRAVSQLSKSALNMRSQFLGNEASMIAGVF